jgi:hypothetical protein
VTLARALRVANCRGLGTCNCSLPLNPTAAHSLTINEVGRGRNHRPELWLAHWRVPQFVLYTTQVAKQLALAHGLVGHSLLSRSFSMRFWTPSVWESEEAFQAIVQNPAHVHLMAALATQLWPR